MVYNLRFKFAEFFLCLRDFETRSRTLANICDAALLEDSQRLKAVNYFRRKAPSQMFGRILTFFTNLFVPIFVLMLYVTPLEVSG